ncbi:MAG: OmpA family protein [Bacteroidetes bacterium]|nr:OmpA family protein [Bacteroidota bacterium]
MKAIKISLLLIALVLAVLLTFGQKNNKSVYTANELKNFGLNAEKAGDARAAIEYYENFLEKKENNAKFSFRLAELYKETMSYEKAKEYYLEAYTLAPEKFVHAYYYYAEMLMMSGDYENAEQRLTEFRKADKSRLKDSRSYISKLKSDMKGIEFALEDHTITQEVTIRQLNATINKNTTELSPLVLNDSTLIYSTFVPVNETGGNYRFMTACRSGNEWEGGHEVGMPVNSDEFSTGNGVFSANGNRFYFTRSKINRKNRPHSEIYVSEKINGTWSGPVRLNDKINYRNYTSTHPAIGTDTGKNTEVLYFVSDRPGGRGGLDIWYAVYNPKTGDFDEPKNAGTRINTSGNERTPFYDRSAKVLYFSSDGLPGYGGYDIYRATGEQKKWSRSKNLGAPVNSSLDDLYYVTGAGNEGFFVSNRAETGDRRHDDIYAFAINERNIRIRGSISGSENIISNVTASAEGVSEDPARIPLQNSTLLIYLVDEEANEEFLIDSIFTGQESGFSLSLEKNSNYKIVARAVGYDTGEFMVSTFGGQDILQMGELLLEKSWDAPVAINNIFYTVNSAELTKQAREYLDSALIRIMITNPGMTADIRSYTDASGEEEYNLQLSRQRAENVKEYLIQKGIDVERIMTNGFGESDDKRPDEYSRRTEIKLSSDLEYMAEDRK